MNVYFAGSIRGGDSPEQRAIYDLIVQSIKDLGHYLTSEHQAANAASDMHKLSDDEIFRRDIWAICASDLLIAEISRPSHGVGFEIGFALYSRHIPVLCLFQAGANPSAMLTGCSDVNLFEYTDAAHIPERLELAIKFAVDSKGLGRVVARPKTNG